MRAMKYEKQRHKTIPIVVFLSLVVGMGCIEGKDYHVDYPDYPKEFFCKASTTPYIFLGQISKYFILYKKKTGFYPKQWIECSLVLSDYDDALRETLHAPGTFIVADRNLMLEKSSELITYDRMATRKFSCKYKITRSEETGFEITAKGDYFPYVWATDGFNIWHYYEDPQEEDRIVEELNERIGSFFVSGKERRALMNKMITLRNDKVLAYYFSYIERYQDDESMLAYLTDALMESSILSHYMEYREKLKRLDLKYQNHRELKKNIDEAMQLFDVRKRNIPHWKRVESWVFMVPYGMNSGVNP